MTQSARKASLGMHTRVFMDLWCACVGVCVHCTHLCSAIPSFSDMQQRSQIHTAEQRRPGPAYQSQDRTESKRESTRKPVMLGDKEHNMKEKHPLASLLSPTLLVFTSADSFSSRPAERVAALQLIQRDSPSQVFPAEGRGEEKEEWGAERRGVCYCGCLAIRRRSRVSLLCLDINWL